MGGEPTGDGEDDIKTLLKALLAKLEGNATGDNDDKPDGKDNKDPTCDGEDDEEKPRLPVTLLIVPKLSSRVSI
jgi:hypothetical protein